ncbi:sodium/hydrogen exchanger 10-like isoform X2 [Hemicordylus capensis]|uniref:sodium/hydrogen exchanger 10-like isoform X2 n=1 Tax=Hemicordylus capensis TaxID=884348 RepID=UPI00230293A5|nr:sodium/hydrogen exchanger 10-like isoform X2 [Hemicordylus capensis]
MTHLNLSFAAAGPADMGYRATRQVPGHGHGHRYHQQEEEEDEYYFDKWDILPKDLPVIVLLVFATFAAAALLRTILKETKMPILVFIFFVGVALGLIDRFASELEIVKTIASIDPVLFIHTFSPAIIFSAAFDMDFYIFRKSIWQLVHPTYNQFQTPVWDLHCFVGFIWKRDTVLLLAVPGFLVNSALLAFLTFKLNKFDGSFDYCMLFGVILSTTDPILSVASVKNIGLSKILINLIKGESLLNDAISIIIFEFHRDLSRRQHKEMILEFLTKMFLKCFASAVFGFLSSRVTLCWLKYIFNDGIVEVVLSFSTVYLIFYIAEQLGMSGIIAVCILGLLLDSVSFSPGVDLFLYKFWAMLTFLAHVLLYLIMGIVITHKTILHVKSPLSFFIITVYLSLNLVRAMVVLALSPFLSHVGYGFNWRWGAVIVWSGIRGTFSFNMALALSQEKFQHEKDTSTSVQILLHSGIASLLTLIINSTTVKKLVMALGLCSFTLPKRMALHNAVQRIRQIEANTFSMLKLDRFLADANWEMAEEAIQMEYPFRLDSEEISNLSKTLKCQECDADTTFERNPQQIADLMEEARLRLLTAQMASYRKQYSNGILNQDAAQTLIGAAESYVDIKGKFMNIHEVKTYWESKGFLVTLKKWLTDWVYNVKEEKSKPSRNKILKMCREVVFMDEFECMSTIVTFLNSVPIILNFMGSVSSVFLPQLRMMNYYFLGLYTLEAILKALAMGRTYIYHHWNLFELLIVVLGFIDIMITSLFKSVSPSTQVIAAIEVFQAIRLLRLLRLLKHVIPKAIYLLDTQINKQLTFRYDIAKGYVQGEEDIKGVIGQIAGHERVYSEISKILETNKQEAMKELGLMQREYPEIVIAVKTKQAVQTVLNAAYETLKFMISGGIVDRNEGTELHKVILKKKKQLAMLPPRIAPATAEELLRNVIWLQNEKNHIEYIQKAQILYYDYGGVICEEHEQPGGIYLIVSGMTKLHGSAPRYGVDKEHYLQTHPAGIPYTDYLATGAIIGELNCLTNQEMEYTVTCETAVQTCFISIDDLLEAFDTFLDEPSLEYKIWMKIALDVAVKTFKENYPDKNWAEKLCMQFSNMYVTDVPNHTKCDIYNGTMDDVILVHGTVQDCQTLQRYAAPHILPKLCHQVQGTAPITKLLVIKTADTILRKNSGMYSVSQQYHATARRMGHATLTAASETEGESQSTLNTNLEHMYVSSTNSRWEQMH